jgi:hypothetical protein
MLDEIASGHEMQALFKKFMPVRTLLALLEHIGKGSTQISFRTRRIARLI